ncbi:MAG TPA: nicotinate-nucleotide adenylyltransferase [Myxococcota bacterium]|nr:nicotinate-nucleotide adenylyltransferase [Myxococcota bacterium]
MTRIGVFGGTFNPIHLGHLRAAEEVAEGLALERVLLVPSACPPHKASGAPLAPAGQRLAWVEAACAGNPRLAACDIEIARGGASYTVDTLRALAERNAPAHPVFIIGSDAFAELDTWREPKQLFALADFAVMARPGTPGRLADWIPGALRADFELSPAGDAARHRATGGSVRAVTISALAVSSSDIRDRIRRGTSIRYLVPEAVRRDIETSRVYAVDGS